MNRLRNVAILVFDDVEVLDFAGPYEVFNVACGYVNPAAFYIYAVGITEKPVFARGRFTFTPRYSIESCPQADILIIPGGFGIIPLLTHQGLLSWITQQEGKVEWLCSVCTGALLLAKAGVLRQRQATTHHTAFEQLQEISPTTMIVKDRRFVRSSQNIYTSGGITAGIDISLHLVKELTKPEVHAAVVEEMEYGWNFGGYSPIR